MPVGVRPQSDTGSWEPVCKTIHEIMRDRRQPIVNMPQIHDTLYLDVLGRMLDVYRSALSIQCFAR